MMHTKGPIAIHKDARAIVPIGDVNKIVPLVETDCEQIDCARTLALFRDPSDTMPSEETYANAARFVASWNALEGFGIAAIEAGVVAGLVAALKTSQTALNDWIHTYAGEMCDEDDVKQSIARIGEYGTLAYIASVQAQNRAVLAKIEGAV